jgi:hypothetical protein
LTIRQIFEPINKAKQDIKAFDCGKDSMNIFLKRYGVKHSKLGLSQTYVLTSDQLNNNKAQIVSYFTLAGSTVLRDSLSTSTSLPAYPIPVIILARLAVDINFQKKNIGKKALISALRKACELSNNGLSAYGLILDVLDAEALAFYKKFNFFHQLTDNSMKLFVGMKNLQVI